MSKKKEIWKSLDFLGYSDYEVSNFGNVKSLNYKRTGKERILKYGKRKDNYMYVVLCKDGKCKNYLIHRLVALAFIKNNNNYPCVNHKDENKQNNRVDNLEFCSVLYNNTYNNAHIKRGEKNKGKKLSEEHKQKLSIANKGNIPSNRKPILQFTLDNIFLREWDSAKSASIELNIDSSAITKVCKGKQKFAYGYIWKYKK